MNKKTIWICFLLLLIITACQSAEATPTPTISDEDDNSIRPTVTAPAVPGEVTPPATNETGSPAPGTEAYPAPPDPTDTPEGYPAPPTPEPTIDPYPVGGFVWLIQAVGEQCAGAEKNSYPDLQEAVAALTAAGIPVRSSGMVDLPVCAACGCPTSAHYRVEIESVNLENAEALGWIKEE